MMLNASIWPLSNLQTKQTFIILPIQQADLDLCCALTESVDTVVYVDKQKMPSLDCTDAHADLDLRCP